MKTKLCLLLSCLLFASTHQVPIFGKRSSSLAGMDNQKVLLQNKIQLIDSEVSLPFKRQDWIINQEDLDTQSMIQRDDQELDNLTQRESSSNSTEIQNQQAQNQQEQNEETKGKYYVYDFKNFPFSQDTSKKEIKENDNNTQNKVKQDQEKSNTTIDDLNKQQSKSLEELEQKINTYFETDKVFASLLLDQLKKIKQDIQQNYESYQDEKQQITHIKAQQKLQKLDNEQLQKYIKFENQASKLQEDFTKAKIRWQELQLEETKKDLEEIKDFYDIDSFKKPEDLEEACKKLDNNDQYVYDGKSPLENMLKLGDNAKKLKQTDKKQIQVDNKKEQTNYEGENVFIGLTAKFLY